MQLPSAIVRTHPLHPPYSRTPLPFFLPSVIHHPSTSIPRVVCLAIGLVPLIITHPYVRAPWTLIGVMSFVLVHLVTFKDLIVSKFGLQKPGHDRLNYKGIEG
jgi:hypothetical protein